MITIHHLGVSQSDRIVWLMEELELPYKLQWHDRGEDMLAPESYRALHPAGTAPIIEDGDTILAESAAIVEYIIHRHGKGRLALSPEHPSYGEYLYWLHNAASVQSMFFLRLARGSGAEPGVADVIIERRENAYYQHMEDHLGQHQFLAGDEFTAADIMMLFNLTSLAQFGGRSIEGLSNITAYVERICARPAYQKAMGIAGPAAQKPADA